MTRINPISDVETTRQKRNQTDSQKRNTAMTREGVLVNSLVKDTNCTIRSDVYDSMIISDSAQLPEQIHEDKKTPEKRLTPMIVASLAVMSAVALMSVLVKSSAKTKIHINREHPEKALEAITRIITINEEKNQAWFQMVQCPNRKTILAGAGVFALSAMAFMGKMFTDGFKDVWVKKKEADIQKDLQEKLIAVETKSFSGKIQIIRNMMATKAKEFDDYLGSKPEKYPTFQKMMSLSSQKFTGNKNKDNCDNNDSLKSSVKYIATGLLTLTSIVGLGFLALKNLRKGKVHMEQSVKDAETVIDHMVSISTKQTVNEDKHIIKNVLTAMDAKSEYIKEKLSALPLDDEEREKFIEQSVFDITKSVTKIEKNIGGSGTPKPSFSSFTDDYKAFFYTWLLEKDNKLFKNLFLGMTTIAAFAYGGKVAGEAMKEVQVKKMNADTELELQERLVSTELRNFKAKKDAAINPLTEEFYAQIQKGKPKEELKTIAENILFEVKNGPPFVYS